MIRELASAPKAVALIGVLVLGGLAASLPARAATVVLPSPGQMFWSAQLIGSPSGNTTTTPTGNFGNAYMLSVPGQYSFLDSFGAPQSSVLTGTTSTIGPYAFQDTYEFSVAQAASGDALAVSLNLGLGSGATFDISNLQFRLYEVASNTPPGQIGLPGGSTLIAGWTGTSGPSTGNAIQANFSNIQAGTYFLDVAGTADGAFGGGYVGQLNLAPVPLPAALPLLLSGLGLFGGLWRRRAAN